jgi:pimeloyl-ACP methyl ester carboxylesterase
MVSMDRYVDTNGIRLRLLDFGGDGPTIVLLPGLTANATFFAGLVEAGLAPALHVVAVDLRGRGRSDKPDTGYGMDDHAADIVGVLDDLEIERAILGGHSFGGLLTYYLAANVPDRVDRCVVLDAPAYVDPMIVEQIQPTLDRLGRTLPSREEYLETVKAMPYYAGWWHPLMDDFYREDAEDLPDGTVRARAQAEHIQQAVALSAEVDWPAVVDRIRQPTLLIRATEPFGPPGYPALVGDEVARRSVALITDCRLVELEGNHMTAFFGKPARVAAEAIVAFVAEGA